MHNGVQVVSAPLTTLFEVVTAAFAASLDHRHPLATPSSATSEPGIAHDIRLLPRAAAFR
ncbi:hypothetical protein [Pseudomonas paraeruginosa]|uniref:hypothetical protein n=1 Tax=Pseudomonas paraeruginosa TaxID=2994495 RepID=UPI0039FC3129